MNTIEKIEKNAKEIVGVIIGGLYYHVDYIEFDNAGKLYGIHAYQLDENNCYMDYFLEREEFENNNKVKLFILKSI